MSMPRTFLNGVARCGRDRGWKLKRNLKIATERCTCPLARPSMTGTRRAGLILQNRDRNLLRELDVMRIYDREQAAVVGGFRSIRRVNDRLLKLVRAGILRRILVANPRIGQ